MPECQAINCTNRKDGKGKSFFSIPNPLKKKTLCRKWIDNLRNAKLDIETFVYNKSTVVCEDHFTKDSFQGLLDNPVAESLGYRSGHKVLKDDAVPTIIKTNTEPKPERASTTALLNKKRNALLKNEVKSLKEKNDKNGENLLKENTTTASKKKLKTKGRPNKSKDEITEDICHVTLPSTDYVEAPSTNCQTKLILECGHPCFLCMQANNTQTSMASTVTLDHSYFKSPEPSLKLARPQDHKSILGTNSTNDLITDISPSTPVTTATCEVSICSPIKMFDKVQSSTPLKPSTSLDSAVLVSPCVLDKFHEEMVELSQLSCSIRDDSKDLDYEHDQLENISSDSDNGVEKVSDDVVRENKYIVFDSSLNTLFSKLKCQQCDCPVDQDDIRKEYCGSSVSCLVHCINGHLIIHWSSQPEIGKMPAGNLLASAALLFSGQTYTRMSQFASFLNLQFISHTTFEKIQRQHLMPVILQTWNTIQGSILQNIREQGRQLRLAGDGRCDSPGYSAKYLTYSLMDMETQQVVTFVVVQVNETGSSVKMEVEGFRKCLLYLLDLGFSIEVLATDRHVQIRSVMKKEYEMINHQFDVWHLAKNVKKRLVKKAKCKGAEELSPWIKSVCNHLWWCASNCEGDKDWLEESWKSVVHHVANEHSFDGEHLRQCQHEPLDPEVPKTKKWLKKGSKAHNALKEIVLNKRLVKDIRQLSEFCHTGSLEVYHSLMLKYVPKRQEFSYDQMVARTALAVIDHNMSQNRQQMRNKAGEKIYRMVCPKATSQWVVKPKYETKSYDWVSAMMDNVVTQKETHALPPTSVTNHGNIAPIPRPNKSELVSNLMSRFSK